MSVGDDEFNFNYENVANSNFDGYNNYLDFYDDETHKKEEHAKATIFDFANKNQNPRQSQRGDGGKSVAPAHVSSLSFEFTQSKISNGDMIFGQEKSTAKVSESNDVGSANPSQHHHAHYHQTHKRPLNFDFNAKKTTTLQNASHTVAKSKKASISLNSLQNIQPVGMCRFFSVHEC